MLADAHLVQRYTIGIDASTLEANAVRCDNTTARFTTPFEEVRWASWSNGATETSVHRDVPTCAELVTVRTGSWQEEGEANGIAQTNPLDGLDAKITKHRWTLSYRIWPILQYVTTVDLETGPLSGRDRVQAADEEDTPTTLETSSSSRSWNEVEAASAHRGGLTMDMSDKAYITVVTQTMVPQCPDRLRPSFMSQQLVNERRKWTRPGARNGDGCGRWTPIGRQDGQGRFAGDGC